MFNHIENKLKFKGKFQDHITGLLVYIEILDPRFMQKRFIFITERKLLFYEEIKYNLMI